MQFITISSSNDNFLVNPAHIVSIRFEVLGSDCHASYDYQDELYTVISMVNGDRYRVSNGIETDLIMRKLDNLANTHGFISA